MTAGFFLHVRDIRTGVERHRSGKDGNQLENQDGKEAAAIILFRAIYGRLDDNHGIPLLRSSRVSDDRYF